MAPFVAPFCAPFVAGLLAAPLVKRIVKPIARGTVKTSVGLVYDAKQASLKARDEVKDAATQAARDKGSRELAASGNTDEAGPDGARTHGPSGKH
ncbi:DUF5132 domain-containing protein [Streptomyces sp. NPDC047718]|uniref:DUF5132 domain-containing protein n=1 Tax=Streptomyces sp. NPDC047718 TaxID=3155479 RepID=UPI00340BD194